MAGSPPNLHTMDSRSACIQGVLKVKVKVKGHVIRALSWILGMSYSVIDGLVVALSLEIVSKLLFAVYSFVYWQYLIITCISCGQMSIQKHHKVIELFHHEDSIQITCISVHNTAAKSLTAKFIVI